MKKITSHPVVRNGHNIVLTIASILLVTTLFYVAFFASDTNNAKAGVNGTLSGWAWSDNIGWISFNCIDTSSCGTVDYSVDMAVNGDLSGYAWSDNIGWISFNDSAGCSQNPCQPKLTGNNLQGWARALSYGDGWDGWVSLKGTTYGVTKSGSDFNNYAWDASDISGESIGIGWIDWSPAFGGVIIGSTPPPQCSDGIDNDLNGCFDFPDDSGCTSSSDTTESGGSCSPQCSNGIDDDLNGCADFPDDSGCTSSSDTTESRGGCPSIYQCSDGIDNTDPEDTVADANDPGCYNTGGYNTDDDNETDILHECSNFFDDDGDGLLDYPNDPGCSDANDNREFNFRFEGF